MPVDKMDNCEVYDGKASFSTCIRCIETMFLQTSTTCTLRVNATIANCKLLSANKDHCSVCADGFLLTSDNLKCLPVIANCLTYDTAVTVTADT